MKHLTGAKMGTGTPPSDAGNRHSRRFRGVPAHACPAFGEPVPILAARGFTMAEAVLSIFIVGVVLVAALTTVGASGRTQQKTSDRSRGTALAQDLMSEILSQAYADPSLGPGSFGLGADEVGNGSRALWDDVDDYDGLSESPLKTKDGTAIQGFENWRRRVEVRWVQPDNLAQTSGSETQAKRVTVTVLHGNVPVASIVAARTSAWVGVPGGQGGAAGNHPPTAIAQAFPDSGPPPLTVTLFGGTSTDPDAGDQALLTYRWDFGDGGSGTGMLVTHTYSAGSYTATLTVSDGKGGVDTDAVDIDVGQ